MKAKLTFLTLLFLSTMTQVTAQDTDTETIIKAHAEWLQASERGEWKHAGDIMAEDFVHYNAQGIMMPKSFFVDEARAGELSIDTLQMESAEGRTEGNMGFITGVLRLKFSRKNADIDGRYRFTRIFVKQEDGQWKMIHSHNTALEEKDLSHKA
tara:strand:- start:47022 stop:47483 length:462 start_codon:yes stop_codon:yes gene_type:complete